MGAHGLLLEVLEIRHIHELLEFIHFVELDPNGLLLVLVFSLEDIYVHSLGL